MQLLKPIFAEEGSNTRKLEDAVYSSFMKYLREASSKLIYCLFYFHSVMQFVICVNLIHSWEKSSYKWHTFGVELL